MHLATLALAAALAGASEAQTTKSPGPKAVPMTVQVQATSADAEVQAWAKELRIALAARSEEFRLVKEREKPELVVRIDSVAKGEDDKQVMNGALVTARGTRPFNFTDRGDTRSQAERFARNLRKLVDQPKAAGK
jgi:hypothetical protein